MMKWQFGAICNVRLDKTLPQANPMVIIVCGDGSAPNWVTYLTCLFTFKTLRGFNLCHSVEKPETMIHRSLQTKTQMSFHSLLFWMRKWLMFIPTLVRRCHRPRGQTNGGDASPPSLAQTVPIHPRLHVSRDAHGCHIQRPQPLRALLHGPSSSHASALRGAVPSQAAPPNQPIDWLVEAFR